ncbi:hypothetical protein L204_105445 [Cryptococcus depauperatus]
MDVQPEITAPKTTHAEAPGGFPGLNTLFKQRLSFGPIASIQLSADPVLGNLSSPNPFPLKASSIASLDRAVPDGPVSGNSKPPKDKQLWEGQTLCPPIPLAGKLWVRAYGAFTWYGSLRIDWRSRNPYRVYILGRKYPLPVYNSCSRLPSADRFTEMTPTVMAFSALISLTGTLFMLWHTWHYDHWRCLLYSKDNWFRTVMCYILFGSLICLQVYTWIEVHVLYDEYWIYLPPLKQTIVTPWQLYTPTHYRIWKLSLYFITAGWGFLQGVHLEEFLYWGYLIKSINTPGGPKSSWLRSGFFKIWIVLFVASFALLIGAVHIENHNLDMIRAYLFLVGSCMSLLLAFASIGLCLILPSFLRSIKRHGVDYEVLERLHFFAEMNEIRTVCRLVYSISFLTLSADAFTEEKRINKSQFWADLLYLVGHLGLFLATCLSIVILLPRNMTSESLPTAPQALQPMVAYKPPATEGYAPRRFLELGQRLNVTHGGKGDSLSNNGNNGFEMQITPPIDDTSSGYSSKTKIEAAPFSEVVEKNKRARFSELPGLPTVVQKFTSPFETQMPSEKGPAKVFVTTSHTVREE